ncbi:hypothetical protein [Pedobacter sp. GR22-6]|uniref:hypothetical protein n=1 Tax=Pedobacter sp. GR22-6 TaxID=3127957 RepID=UPI00307E915E
MATSCKNLCFILGMLFMLSCRPAAYITHGSSFGHCQGMCNKELKLYPKKTEFKTWSNGPGISQLEKGVATTGKDYEAILAKIDVKKFKRLKNTYGCPDCADGGAEWISLKMGFSTKKVTFEFGNPPEELKSINDDLRKVQESFETKKK